MSNPTDALIAVIAFGAWQYFGEIVTFAQIYILTDGGPQGATQTALYYVYQQAFGLGASGSIGLADAMSVILFFISLVVTLAQITLVSRRAPRCGPLTRSGPISVTRGTRPRSEPSS